MAELVVAYLKRFAEDETKVIVSATKGLLTKYFLVCRFDPQVLVSCIVLRIILMRTFAVPIRRHGSKSENEFGSTHDHG